MTLMKQVCLTALIASTAACSSTHEGSAEFTHLSVLNSQQVAVHRPDGPDAIVSSAGELSIAGKPVSVNQPQKDLLARYFATAQALQKDGFATGMAGASTAMTALGSVFNGLTSGNTDQIGKDVEAKAAKVEAAASKVCADVSELATTQDALAATLQEFKPYALITPQTIDKCNRG